VSNDDLEAGHEASSAELEVPPKVTLAWLFKHMPFGGWLWIAGILLTTFGVGVLVGNTTFGRELYGIPPTHPASTEQIARQLFDSLEQEEFRLGESNAIVLASDLRGEHTVFLELRKTPAPSSVQFQIGEFLGQPGSYELFHNIILMRFTGPESNLRRNPVFVRYLPDESPTVNLRRDGDRVFAGGRLLNDGAQTFWPSDENLP
jgi:hypothetical protein